MKIFLSALLLVLIGMQTFSIDASLVPGLSLKNAMIYSAALLLIGQYVLSGKFRFELPGPQVAFVFLIVYAILSWLVLAFAIRNPEYGVLVSAMRLKSDLVDHMIVFLVFFYGLRSLEDALSVGQALFVGVVFANVVTVLDASGVLGWNIVPLRTEAEHEFGRVQGAFGEANEHAAVVAMVLPALVAKGMLDGGIRRVAWFVAVAFGIAAIFMTASRGAMVGLMGASVVGAVVFRRYVSFGRVVGLGLAAVALVSIVVLALTDTYTALLRDRVIGLTFSGDVTEASSGRTVIWGEIIDRMVASPWSFLSGFGWDAYSFMEFEFAPHNTYLGMWFNLGVPGLLAFLFVLGSIFLCVSEGVHSCRAEQRPLLIGLWIGFLALCVSVFFVQLSLPWLYVWAYAGIMTRTAICLATERSSERPPVGKPATPGGIVGGRARTRRLGAPRRQQNA